MVENDVTVVDLQTDNYSRVHTMSCCTECEYAHVMPFTFLLKEILRAQSRSATILAFRRTTTPLRKGDLVVYNEDGSVRKADV